MRTVSGITSATVQYTLSTLQNKIWNFHIKTVHHDIIKFLFIHQPMHQWVVLKSNIKIYIKTQPMHQWVVLKSNIKIYIKTTPTYFGVTVTPSSGSVLMCAY